VIRQYRVRDEPAVEALLRAAWPDDPVMVEISNQHGVDFDDGRGRSRRTRVAEHGGEVVGVASLVGSARHQARYFLVVVVAEPFRRRGIGSGLLAELLTGSDGRPLQARVRVVDRPGLAFLRALGFDVLMRNRTGVVDPGGASVWIERQPRVQSVRSASRERVARAHEVAYRLEHASWSPATERPLEESLATFCGDSWLPETALLAEDAVASLHGPPLALAADELFLIAGSTTGDDRSLRGLVAAELEWAGARCLKVSVEADEANAAMWTILSELPARLDPELLLLATDL
jgi:N-acetylglutamate synthase-like GNAT family acetyltransferase